MVILQPCSGILVRIFIVARLIILVRGISFRPFLYAQLTGSTSTNACKPGHISDALLSCPCSLIGRSCKDPLSICDRTRHCVCDSRYGYLSPSGDACLAYSTTSTAAPVACPACNYSCPTTTAVPTTTIPSTTTATPDKRCGNFEFHTDRLGQNDGAYTSDGSKRPQVKIQSLFGLYNLAYAQWPTQIDLGGSFCLSWIVSTNIIHAHLIQGSPEESSKPGPVGNSCVFLDKGTSIEVQQSIGPTTGITNFYNRLVSCPGADHFQIEIISISATPIDIDCDTAFLAIYDKMICGAQITANIGTKFIVPGSTFAVGFYADNFAISYRIRVACV